MKTSLLTALALLGLALGALHADIDPRRKEAQGDPGEKKEEPQKKRLGADEHESMHRKLAEEGEANLKEIAKLKKLQRIDIDADAFEVRIPSAPFPEAGELPASTDTPSFTFKAKARKHNTFRISPRDREMLLKTLNRSINLRSAS